MIYFRFKTFQTKAIYLFVKDLLPAVPSQSSRGPPVFCFCFYLFVSHYLAVSLFFPYAGMGNRTNKAQDKP